MTLVFLLEEPSMKAFLEVFLPRILPEGIYPKLIPHQGKSDLEKSLPRKLRAWQDPNARFVVVRDQDAGDCRDIKARLREMCEVAGKGDALVRIACRELEAWFMGDLVAVEHAFDIEGLGALQSKRKYRNADELVRPSEHLAQLVPGYGKVAGARQLGSHISPQRCSSPSFQQFLVGLAKITGQEAGFASQDL